MQRCEISHLAWNSWGLKKKKIKNKFFLILGTNVYLYHVLL